MSALFLELKYSRMLGQSVERWKVKNNSPFHATGRCPICGDSKKSKTLCRFHVREYMGTCFVSCFNCGYSSNLIGYLKFYEPSMHSEFAFEKYRVSGNKDEPIIKTPKIVVDDSILIPTKIDFEEPFVLDLPYVSELPENDPVRLYVASRLLPDYPFQYAENFYDFSSQFNEELSSGKKDEPRLVIPFFDRKGAVFAYQGRDLSGKSKQKYITITVDSKVPKVFGIDRCDFKKPIKIVEGPIDSLFLKNSLASVNASLVATAKKLSTVTKKDALTLVLDNEPRNEQIVKMYLGAIDDGYRVCIWPKRCDNKKDINQMVMEGIPAIEVEKIIENNSHSGLMAQLKFGDWKMI